MLGVVIEKLGQLRKYGYRFIENEEGDFMRVEYGSNIIQTVSLTPQGKLELRDSQGYRQGVYNSVNYSMDLEKKLYIRVF